MVVREILKRAVMWAMLPFAWFGLWHGCLYLGCAWPTRLNIPGFMLAIMAWPWSELAFAMVQSQARFLPGAASWSQLLIAFGFGLNISLLFIAVKYSLQRFRH